MSGPPASAIASSPPGVVGASSVSNDPVRDSPQAARGTRRSRLRFPAWLPKPSITAVAIAVAALIEAGILTWVQTQNYLGYHTRQGDLGNYNQMFSTTVHGQGFFAYTTNILGGSDGTIWSIHFIPTLVLLVPVYAAVSSPITLMVLKQVALTLGAVPVYAIARVYFRGRIVPVVFAALYLVSPLTTSPDWNNFNPESFIPLTVLITLYFFITGRFRPFLISWCFALGTIESVPPLLVLFALGGIIGTYVMQSRSPYWTSRQQRKPLFIALLIAVAWFGVAFGVLHVFGGGGVYGSSYGSRYTTLGATSFVAVFPRAVTHPSDAVAALRVDGWFKVDFLIIILLASGVVSLLGGLRYLLPPAGFLALAVLSNNGSMFSFGTQYTSMFWPFLIVGAIEGTALIVDWMNRTDPSARHRALSVRLSSSARSVLRDLSALPPESPARVYGLRAIHRVVALIEADQLGEAEADLRRLARHLRPWLPVSGSSPPTGPTEPPTPPAGPVPPGPRVQARRTWTSREDRSVAVALGIVVVCIVAGAALTNPLIGDPVAGGSQYSFGLQGPNTETQQLDAVLALIPGSASVLTTAHLFPQLSSRPNAYVISNETTLRGVYGIDSFAGAIGYWENHSEFIALDYRLDPTNAVIYQNYTNASGFGAYASENGAVVLERGWTGAPRDWVPWTASFAGGNLKLFNGTTSSNYSTSLGPSFYHGGVGGPLRVNNSTLWNGPRLLYLPPGNYSVTFRLSILAPVEGTQLKLEVIDNPVWVTDTVPYPATLPDFHKVILLPAINASTGRSPGIQLALDEFRTQTNATSFQSENISLNFTWARTGYVSFPGYLESTTMSVYLQSVTVVQTSPRG